MDRSGGHWEFDQATLKVISPRPAASSPGTIRIRHLQSGFKVLRDLKDDAVGTLFGLEWGYKIVLRNEANLNLQVRLTYHILDRDNFEVGSASVGHEWLGKKETKTLTGTAFIARSNRNRMHHGEVRLELISARQ